MPKKTPTKADLDQIGKPLQPHLQRKPPKRPRPRQPPPPRENGLEPLSGGRQRRPEGIAGAHPPPPKPAPQPDTLADRLTANQALGEGRVAALMMRQMDEAGAKAIPLSDELVRAVGYVAAEFITGSADRPATRRSRKAGALLILRATAENRARFEAAQRAEDGTKERGGGREAAVIVQIVAPPGATGTIPLPPHIQQQSPQG